MYSKIPCLIISSVDTDDGVAPFSGGSFAADNDGSVGGIADEGGRMSGPPGEVCFFYLWPMNYNSFLPDIWSSI